MSGLAEIATSMVSGGGYPGYAFGLIVDSAGVPIPSEVLIPLAAVLVRSGRFTMAAVIVIGTVAQTLGALGAYYIGRAGKVSIVERYGKYVFFSKRELDMTTRAFEKHGALLSGVGRCVPIIRTFVGFPAGVAGMKLSRFLAATILGSFIWTAALAAAGYYLATEARLAVIDEWSKKAAVLVAVALLLGVVVYIKRRRHSG